MEIGHLTHRQQPCWDVYGVGDIGRVERTNGMFRDASRMDEVDWSPEAAEKNDIDAFPPLHVMATLYTSLFSLSSFATAVLHTFLTGDRLPK
jgi:hypothetical protein